MADLHTTAYCADRTYEGINEVNTEVSLELYFQTEAHLLKHKADPLPRNRTMPLPKLPATPIRDVIREPSSGTLALIVSQ